MVVEISNKTADAFHGTGDATDVNGTGNFIRSGKFTIILVGLIWAENLYDNIHDELIFDIQWSTAVYSIVYSIQDVDLEAVKRREITVIRQTPLHENRRGATRLWYSLLTNNVINPQQITVEHQPCYWHWLLWNMSQFLMLLWVCNMYW